MKILSTVAVMGVCSVLFIGCVPKGSSLTEQPPVPLVLRVVSYATDMPIDAVRIEKIHHEQVPFTLSAAHEIVDEVTWTDAMGKVQIVIRPGQQLILRKKGFNDSSVGRPGGTNRWTSYGNSYSGVVKREAQGGRLEVVMVPENTP